MKPLKICLFCVALACSAWSAHGDAITPAEVIEGSVSSDWRQPIAENLLYLELGFGRVVFELAPLFAPEHVANLRTLVGEKYFDGLAIIRSQDNYVVQWGDPKAGTDEAKPQGKAKTTLAPEFYRPMEGVPFSAINSRDAYADYIGFSDGFAAGHDGERVWLTHCYGALGAGRGLAADSGNAAELYVVTGHSPRHLDRNVTLLGRVIQGIEHLSSLPRGSDTLGFYAADEETVAIKSIRFGTDLPAAEQVNLEIMRTNTPTFARYVTSRTFRKNEWFLDEAGKIEVCNVGVPVRPVQDGTSGKNSAD